MFVRVTNPEGESPVEGVGAAVREKEALGDRVAEGLPDALPPPAREGVGLEEADLLWVSDTPPVSVTAVVKEGVRVGREACALLDTVGERVEQDVEEAEAVALGEMEAAEEVEGDRVALGDRVTRLVPDKLVVCEGLREGVAVLFRDPEGRGEVVPPTELLTVCVGVEDVEMDRLGEGERVVLTVVEGERVGWVEGVATPLPVATWV